jgi:hypothetical protein
MCLNAAAFRCKCDLWKYAIAWKISGMDFANLFDSGFSRECSLERAGHWSPPHGSRPPFSQIIDQCGDHSGTVTVQAFVPTAALADPGDVAQPERRLGSIAATPFPEPVA